MIDGAPIRQRWEAVGAHLDERGRRLFAAVEVRTAGRGGLAVVSKITGLARSTINRGEDDLDAEPLPKGRVRRAGGGRRALCESDPGLIPALKRLVEPATLGDPQGNESRLTRLWLQRAESVQQVLRVPGGALAAALDRPFVRDLADQIEGEVAYYRHVFGTVTSAQA